MCKCANMLMGEWGNVEMGGWGNVLIRRRYLGVMTEGY